MNAMLEAHKAIETHLTQLRGLLSCDFAGLAWSENHLITWKVVSGNRNERYKKIILRSGKGIAGQVFRSGRPMIVESFDSNAQLDMKDFPIMLAENLVSGAAVPVIIDRKVKGVLLVGSRSFRSSYSLDIDLISSFAEQLGSMMEARKENDASFSPKNSDNAYDASFSPKNSKEDLK